MKKLTFFMIVFIMLLYIPISAFAEPLAFGNNFSLRKDDTGLETVIVQRRLYDLGYIHFRPTGKYADMTFNAVMRFQSRNGLPATGQLTYETYLKLFSAGVHRAPASAVIPRIFGKGWLISVPAGDLYDWYKIVAEELPVGGRAKITDYNTGLEFTVQRTGGTNHADVQPVDAASAKNLTEAFGGGISWEKRACVVEIGEKRIAASLFGHPNKNDVLKNGHSSGSYCLYFSGSKSDILGGLPDAEHEAQCKKANGQ